MEISALKVNLRQSGREKGRIEAKRKKENENGRKGEGERVRREMV